MLERLSDRTFTGCVQVSTFKKVAFHELEVADIGCGPGIRIFAVDIAYHKPESGVVGVAGKSLSHISQAPRDQPPNMSSHEEVLHAVSLDRAQYAVHPSLSNIQITGVIDVAEINKDRTEQVTCGLHEYVLVTFLRSWTE